MKVEECRQQWNRQRIRHQQYVLDSLRPQERNTPDQSVLGVIVPVHGLLVAGELVSDVPLYIAATYGEDALDYPTLAKITETEGSQSPKDRARAAGHFIIGEQGVKDLGARDRLSCRIGPVEYLT